MIRSIALVVAVFSLLAGGVGAPSSAHAQTCCLCLQCVLPAPPDCGRPLAPDCAAACAVDGCSDRGIGTPSECASAPLCPGAALPVPTVTGWGLAGALLLLAAIAARVLRRQRSADPALTGSA